MIAKYFTEYQKRRFFESAGFRVEMQEFTMQYRATHGTWETQDVQALCVLVDDGWYKMYPLLEVVMQEKLKQMLMDKVPCNYALVKEVAKKSKELRVMSDE